MAKSSPIYLTINVIDQGKLSGFHDMYLKLISDPETQTVDLCRSSDVTARRWLQSCLDEHKTCSAQLPDLPR